MLAYYFPPLGGGGVQRSLKHAKYLPEFGFDPIVVTTTGIGHRLRDPTLAADIPEQAIVVRPPEIPLHMAKWAAQSLLRRARLPTKLAELLAWPDEFAGWVPGALVATLQAVRRHRPVVLYSTSSPVSAHLVGLLASRLTGLPWVADFRDAWTLNPEGEPLLGSASASLERRIVERAATLVVVDETIRLRGLEDGDPRRVVIPNGVDPDDVPLADRARTRDALTIAHVGMLYGARDVMPVLNALRRLVWSGALDAAQIDLRLVGDVRLPPEADLSRLPVTVRGNVDHTEAVAEMAHADVLLLYQPAGWRASTGKIFEYLATGRPILCVAPLDSPAARLVTELGAGVCAAPDDADAIDDALRRLDAARRNGGLAADETVRAEALRRYSRRELARRLAETLDAVAGAARGPAVPLSRVVRS